MSVKLAPLSSPRTTESTARHSWIALAPALLALGLTACGGGDPAQEATATATDADDRAVMQSVAQSSGLTDEARRAAAVATATSSTNECTAIRPFYWEIGRGDGAKASGSVALPGSRLTYTERTPMSIASASKWVWGAYAVQRRNGTLSADDVAFLTMTSGYNQFTGCEPTQTVGTCLAYKTNGNQSSLTVGRFFYNGGHMQKHAEVLGLAPQNNASLATEMRKVLGSDVPVQYSQPQLAGGIFATPQTIGVFLRKIVRRDLVIGNQLGRAAVCTNPTTCPTGEATFVPVPLDESWSYSLGHWVESDPSVGDGAFSSPGAFGFYPWIDASRTTYGMVARVAPDGGFPSVRCGRKIRAAWMTGVAQ